MTKQNVALYISRHYPNSRTSTNDLCAILSLNRAETFWGLIYAIYTAKGHPSDAF